jgi:hypothetical protein
MNPAPIAATLRARRVTGGAVQRAEGRRHRYRVGLKRYHRLHDVLLIPRGIAGAAFLRGRYECNLVAVKGFADARRALKRTLWRAT